MIQKIDVNDTSIAEAVRERMNVATVTNKGLMPGGLMGTKNVQSSVLLCETNALLITGSMLLSVANATSSMPSLYFISISRSTGSTGNPSVNVKVISGSYGIKIKAKTDGNGVCRIYAERLQFTPVLDVLTMNTVGITLKMETADNSAFEGGFEAILE